MGYWRWLEIPCKCRLPGQKVQKMKFELRWNDFQNSFVIIFMIFLDTYRKTPKILWYRTCVFVNFYFLFTRIAGISVYKPMGLFLERLIIGVKNKLRNVWVCFRDFTVCQIFVNASVTLGSEYAGIWLNNAWINCFDYGKARNMPGQSFTEFWIWLRF